MKDKVEEIVEAAEIAEENSVARKRKRDKLECLVDGYGALYPKEKRFYVTSDEQVFFERDKNMAQYHQSGLDKGELRLIDVER